MRADQRRQHLLLLPRETGDVRILQHVGAVGVVLAVGNRQANLVQAGGPAQHARVVVVQLPCLGDLLVQAQGGGFHPRGLDFVDAVALGQRRHRQIARVVVAAAAKHVVQDAFAHRRLADDQALQAQRLEGGLQHQHAAGDDRAAIAGQAGQVDGVDALGLEQPIPDLRQRLRGDRALGQLHGGADLADGLVGAGGTDRFLPAQRAVLAGELLELGGDLGERFLPALLGNLAAGKETAGAGDAAGLQAFAFQRVHAAADDELGGTATDIDDQAQLARLGRLRVGHAKVDQARLLAAGHHFDRFAQRGFRRYQEALRISQLADGVGRQRAHAGGRYIADALAETRQAVQRALARGLRQAALAIQAIGHAHGFTQAINHPQLPQGVTRHDHVEAVGTEIDGGKLFAVTRRRRYGGRDGRHRKSLEAGAAGWQRGSCHFRHLHRAQTPASRVACAEYGASPSAGSTLW